MENFEKIEGLKELSGYGFKVASFNIEGEDGKDKGKHFVAKPLKSLESKDVNLEDKCFVSIILPNGFQQPFKLTYNEDEKCNKWYPFFGVADSVMKDGYIIRPYSRGTKVDEKRYYDNDVLKSISEVLDKYTKVLDKKPHVDCKLEEFENTLYAEKIDGEYDYKFYLERKSPSVNKDGKISVDKNNNIMYDKSEYFEIVPKEKGVPNRDSMIFLMIKINEEMKTITEKRVERDVELQNKNNKTSGGRKRP